MRGFFLLHKVTQRLPEATRRRIAIRFSLTANRNLQLRTYNLQHKSVIRLFGNLWNQWLLFFVSQR